MFFREFLMLPQSQRLTLASYLRPQVVDTSAHLLIRDSQDDVSLAIRVSF